MHWQGLAHILKLMCMHLAFLDFTENTQTTDGPIVLRKCTQNAHSLQNNLEEKKKDNIWQFHQLRFY